MVFNDDQRLHLQFVQNAITRLGQKEFNLKGWNITILSAFLALYADKETPIFLYMAIAPVILFWIINAKYLQLSRQYRELYYVIIQNNNETPLYSMDVKNYNKGHCNYWKTFFSWSVAGFYGSLIILLIVLSLMTNWIFS